MSGEPTLDPSAFERLLEITGDDIAFVDELVDTYLDDAVVQLDSLERAADAADIGALIRPAHTLKSSSENVGAAALAAMCRELETRSREGAVPDAIERVAEARDEFGSVWAALLAARRDRTP